MTDQTNNNSDLILIVDDEASIRGLISRYLARHGYHTREAASGREALIMVQELGPTAIVSDIRMPAMDGMDLLNHVVACDPDMVVILTTGAPSMAVTIEALRAGATDFLPKPIELSKLYEALERGIARRRSRIQSQRRQVSLERQVRSRTRELQDAMRDLHSANDRLQQAYEESVELLRRTSAMRDNETGHHIDRIREFSGLVAEALGLPEPDCSLVRSASPMHDIGKIGIPDQILLKPGKLTPEEFEIIKTHTTIGGEILRDRETPLLKASHIIALTHHEQWDGKGYPKGLKGEDIPLFGRIVSVVDVFDALTHKRCYKEAMSPVEAKIILNSERGKKFDPDVLDAFMSVWPQILKLNGAMTDGEEHS